MSHTNYLSRHRKRWALSQRELALLLGQASRSSVSRLELGAGQPSLRFVVRCELIFGVSAAELFPQLYEQNHDLVMRRAARLDTHLRDRADASSARKRELLSAMINRAPGHDQL